MRQYIAGASALRELHAADNKLTGTLETALSGKAGLRELSVGGNHFFDTADAPVVLGVLSKHPELVHYDLTNNEFHPSPATLGGGDSGSSSSSFSSRAPGHTSVHAVRR